MKKRNTLKTLPLIALLTLGMGVLPAVSQADQGKLVSALSHDGGKGHRDYGKSHGRDKGRYERGHGHKDRGYAKGHDKGHKHVYNYSKGHRHDHGYSHHGHKHHVYRPHRHVDHVIVHDYHDEYDPFRLLLGLHFDNIDIIYRDY